MTVQNERRQALHEQLDALPDDELWRVDDFLTYLRTGDRMFLSMASAPYDDEPETPEEAAAVAEAREQYRRDEFLTAEEAKRLLLP